MVDSNERPYSINDLMVLHNLSYRTIVRLYENEPGVQILQASQDHQQALGRRYRTIRVPRHIYMRVKHVKLKRFTEEIEAWEKGARPQIA